MLVFEFVVGAGVAAAVATGASVAGAVVAAAPPALDFVATGFALLVAVAFVVAVAVLEDDEDDDEADALDVAPGPVTGPPAMFIALVVPN
jgi:membrane protein implicated in regulation of membrane protease activity